MTLAPRILAFLAVSLAFVLSGCQSAGVSGGLSPTSPQTQRPVATAARPQLSSSVEGERVGSGPIRVALLVPKTAGGTIGTLGEQLSNAAKLGMRDFARGRFELVIKDTQGQAAQAQIAASEALKEGASLVLGPLLSANVSSASAITSPSRIPMVAFSSDANRAGNGVYLLSFLPSADVERTIRYGAQQGGGRIVAFLPNGAYGSLVARALNDAAARSGAQVVAVHRYGRTPDSIATTAQNAVPSISQATAIYIPEGGATPPTILNELRKRRAILSGLQILGSGQWETVDTNNRFLQGAIYAGPDKSRFIDFATRYRTAYGVQPASNAALAYDAVGLVAELIRRSPSAPFTTSGLQSRFGFNGATGLFRFENNGRSERGLSIYRINNGQVELADPAPTSFRR